MEKVRFIFMMKRIFLYFLFMAALLTSCTDDDSFTTSRSARLSFSADTLQMDTVFSNVGSSTYTFWVYNHSNDGLRLSSVRLKSGNQTGFRVNVDGSYLDNSLGSVVNDLEVRKGDSLLVFVELTAPENGQLEPVAVEDQLLFQLESGVEQQVCLRAFSWDAVKMTDMKITRDTLIESPKPLVLYGTGMEVDSGVVLTLRSSTLYFHDGAGLTVNGRLEADHVLMRGDRLDRMFTYLPYDRVSGQWRGISFTRTSDCNTMTDCEIRNAYCGILLSDSAQLDSTVQRLTLTRCIIHNAKGPGLAAWHSNLGVYYCQLSNTLGDCLALFGGICEIDHTTLAQFYPFSADRGAALRFTDGGSGLRLIFRGSIATGYEEDVVMGERSVQQSDADPQLAPSFDYLFEDCLLRTPAVADDTVSFRNIIWETPKDSIQGKQHFRIIDEENLYYDFHLDSLSTAQGKGCY